MCPDGLVYNIEVESTHTYLIGSGVVVHNCHHAPSPTWSKVLRAVGSFSSAGPLTIGFTATPERNGGSLGVWEKVVSYMSIREAIFRDFLVPILPAEVIETRMDLDRVRKTGGDYADGSLGEELESSGAIEQIADAILQLAPDRKGVSFTPTVRTAHLLAKALNERGIPAAALDGGTPAELRKAILAGLKDGSIQNVCNCGVLTEGFDESSIDLVTIARPTTVHNLYVQMIGRGTRKHPGKKNLLILDAVGASKRHEIITAVDLDLDLEDAAGKKKDPTGEGVKCPSCGEGCNLPHHRCQLCHRFLPRRIISEGGYRHDNCDAGKAAKVDVFGSSRLRWLPVEDAWCLGAGKEIVVMVPAGPDTWRLASYENGRVKVLHDQLPAHWATGIGEDRAKAFQKLIERDARWLAQPATEIQKGRLLREGLPESALPRVRTKGDAADLITRISGRRAVKKLRS